MLPQLHHLRQTHPYLAGLAGVNAPLLRRAAPESVILPQARHNAISQRRNERRPQFLNWPFPLKRPQAPAKQRLIERAPAEKAAHEKRVNLSHPSRPPPDDQPRLAERPETILGVEQEHPYVRTAKERRKVRLRIAPGRQVELIGPLAKLRRARQI